MPKAGYDMHSPPCPQCSGTDARVKDTRPSSGVTRRRRVCPDCDHRWTTYEVSEQLFSTLRARQGVIRLTREAVNELLHLLADMELAEDDGHMPRAAE